MTNNIKWVDGETVDLTIVDHTGRRCTFQRYLTLPDVPDVARSALVNISYRFVLFHPEDHEILAMFFAGELDHPEEFKAREPVWADGDVVRAVGAGLTVVWVRRNGVWNSTHPNASKDVEDWAISAEFNRERHQHARWEVLASANGVK